MFSEGSLLICSCGCWVGHSFIVVVVLFDFLMYVIVQLDIIPHDICKIP